MQGNGEHLRSADRIKSKILWGVWYI